MKLWVPRPLQTALVSGAVGLTVVVLALMSNSWNPLVFAIIESADEEGDPTGRAGYDGRFVYYIARDPLGAVEKMDAPAYRYQRILYPALAWLLSAGGQPQLLPWALVAINLAAVVTGTGLLGWLLERERSSGWYALLIPLSIGGLFVLRGNMNELLSLTLALVGVAFLISDRPGAATVALALGGLAKEMALLFAAAGVLWLLTQRRWRRAVGLALGSAGPLVGWSLMLTAWLGQSAFSTERTTFLWFPFYGLRSVILPETAVMLAIWIVLPTAGLLLASGRDLWLWRQSERLAGSAGLYAWCVVVNGSFIAFAPRASYADLLAMMRLLLGLMAAGLLWAAAAHRRTSRWLTALWGPSWLLAVMIEGFIR
jgi:hypothetical protein